MNMNTLAALAESASKALEAEDLLAALRILTAGMAEVIGADAAAMLVTVEDPPALVTTVQRELGWGFTESFTERAFHAYHKACGEDMRSRTAVVVHGVPATDDGPETLTSFMSMPLYVNKRLLGLLALASEHPWHAIAEENMAVAGHIAGLLLQAYHRILESSSTDPLTGLFNRKRVQEELEFTASSMSRFGHPVSIVVIDIDNLKAVNETHDHLTGDQVLREMGTLLGDIARASDIVGRIGGDEFAVIMPNTTGQEASQIANHIRSEIHAHGFCDGRLKSGLHVSIGIADSGGQALAAHELIGRADKALYEAKKVGGNRVVVI